MHNDDRQVDLSIAFLPCRILIETSVLRREKHTLPKTAWEERRKYFFLPVTNFVLTTDRRLFQGASRSRVGVLRTRSSSAIREQCSTRCTIVLRRFSRASPSLLPPANELELLAAKALVSRRTEIRRVTV